ncbi:hypothetical protein V6Z12_A06G225600 [Gossypium hirsutum]
MMGGLQLRVPMTAFLATNIFIYTAPFKAVAEACEVDNSIFNMPLLLFVALIGATVGGLLARQRKGELRRLNEQLRQINAALKRQAKIESYAPTLSYTPVVGRISEEDIIVDPRKEELISCLKSGKNFLRNQEHEKAFLKFQTALELAKSLKDPIEEKKAARGLGTYLSVNSSFEPLPLMYQQEASTTCSIRSSSQSQKIVPTRTMCFIAKARQISRRH